MKLFFHKVIFFLLLLGGLLPLRAQPAGLEVITSGERKWELLLQDIAGARQTIDLEYYLLADDASGRMIRDALEEKVREGVRVRLLIENVTNFSIRKAYYRQMEASGIEVRYFTDPDAYLWNVLPDFNFRDHLDAEAIAALTKEGTCLLMNQRSRDQYGSGEVIGNGEKKQLTDAILLEAVPAYNSTEGRENFHPKGNGNGYVLTIDGLRIYIAGDTEDIPEMAALKDIDVAFLPVNQPFTMTVEQCVAAAKAIQPKVLIPYHFSNTDLSTLPELLPGIDVRLRQMQ